MMGLFSGAGLNPVVIYEGLPILQGRLHTSYYLIGMILPSSQGSSPLLSYTFLVLQPLSSSNS